MLRTEIQRHTGARHGQSILRGARYHPVDRQSSAVRAVAVDGDRGAAGQVELGVAAAGPQRHQLGQPGCAGVGVDGVTHPAQLLGREVHHVGVAVFGQAAHRDRRAVAERQRRRHRVVVGALAVEQQDAAHLAGLVPVQLHPRLAVRTRRDPLAGAVDERPPVIEWVADAGETVDDATRVGVRRQPRRRRRRSVEGHVHQRVAPHLRRDVAARARHGRGVALVPVRQPPRRADLPAAGYRVELEVIVALSHHHAVAVVERAREAGVVPASDLPPQRCAVAAVVRDFARIGEAGVEAGRFGHRPAPLVGVVDLPPAQRSGHVVLCERCLVVPAVTLVRHGYIVFKFAPVRTREDMPRTRVEERPVDVQVLLVGQLEIEPLRERRQAQAVMAQERGLVAVH